MTTKHRSTTRCTCMLGCGGWDMRDLPWLTCTRNTPLSLSHDHHFYNIIHPCKHNYYVRMNYTQYHDYITQMILKNSWDLLQKSACHSCNFSNLNIRLRKQAKLICPILDKYTTLYHNFKIDYYFSFDFKFIPIPLSSLFVSSRNLKYSCYKANGHTQSSSASNSQVVMETPSSTTPTKFKVIPCMLHWLQTVEQK